MAENAQENPVRDDQARYGDVALGVECAWPLDTLRAEAPPEELES
jgi:hypothetical protein